MTSEWTALQYFAVAAQLPVLVPVAFGVVAIPVILITEFATWLTSKIKGAP